MTPLSAAYYGYTHQDCVTAYALATLLLPRLGVFSIVVDRKAVAGDRFDDLELTGRFRQRIQVKSHTGDVRPLKLNDFTTKSSINFRIDDAIRSITEDPNPADEYRLLTTFGLPEDDLLPFVKPERTISPLFPGLSTQRFSLDPIQIWPVDKSPVWSHIEAFGREAFVSFCDLFVIEIECPQASRDLQTPGDLEQALFTLLHNRIGVGLWPNHNRDLADAVAQLIYAASISRVSGVTVDQQAVINKLALRVDYGRVEEHFPVQKNILIRQTNTIHEIINILSNNPRIAITGSPGIGKSWLLHQLADKLSSDGWIVATHYCFVSLYDNDRLQRSSIPTVFGSLIAELLDADPSLATNNGPRYAAGPRELEHIINYAIQNKPDRQIVIIVDGLDHADRIPENPNISAAADIVEELATMRLPPEVALILGSQPGNHLTTFLNNGKEYKVHRWIDEHIQELVERLDIVDTFQYNGLESEIALVIGTIVDKADGNPLYATYLCRMADNLAQQFTKAMQVDDIAEYLATTPMFDQDLDAYYQWLVDGISRDIGVLGITELLSLIDFPISADELKQIKPEFSHHADTVLSRLAPILIEDFALGGIRVYHESFQRYIRRNLEADPSASFAAILNPAISWLLNRGFYSDARAYRSLLRMLRRASRDEDIIAQLEDDYVAKSAGHGQPTDAVLANVTIAAEAAAELQNWPALARFIEISRSADYLYHWRLTDHTLAEEYGHTYAEIFGADSLAERLIHDNRCTFPPRPGLILCQLCDENGAIPPWSEYRAAHNLQIQTENTSYGIDSDRAIQHARLIGWLRINGRERSIQKCIEWLTQADSAPCHPYNTAFELGNMYGIDSLVFLIDSLLLGVERAWAYLALTQLIDHPDKARIQANNAIQNGLPWEGWRDCLRSGADLQLFPKDVLKLHELTTKVVTPDVRFQDDLLPQWLTEIQLAAVVDNRIALSGTEASIPTDTWYRRWLRFCVLLARSETTQEDIIESLCNLSQNIEVFKGNPRVCDLYGIHNEIQQSFQDALFRLDNDHWYDALSALGKISMDTITWLQGSRGGPLPLDALFKICFATADTEVKRLEASTLGSNLLSPEHRSGEYYDTHAQDHLLLARLHTASGRHDLAEKAWSEACQYLAGYGQRKDITVYELLDPLEKLASIDPRRVRQCLYNVQPIVERVRMHTDGSETDHALHTWLDIASKYHPAGALSYIARHEIDHLPTYGDLDHALPISLKALEGQIDPHMAAAAWIAVGSEARSESRAALAASESVALIDHKLGQTVWETIVGCLDGDGVMPLPELIDLVADSATRLGIPPPTIAPESSNEITDIPNNSVQHDSAKHNYSLGSHNIFPADASPLQIAYSVRKWSEMRGERLNIDNVVSAVGWKILGMIESGDETSADILIRRIARDTRIWGGISILPDLAQGLSNRGVTRLAALASTFAYTRAIDGWRQFAGEKGETLFQKALDLNTSIAWETLANEVADGVAHGGAYGINAHLIELLVIGNRAEEAFAAWNAACNVVKYRLPATGPYDDIDVIYDYESNNPASMLAAAIISRINHCLVHEKRLAIAAIAIIARYNPLSFAAAFKYIAIEKIPSTTLITLLQVMELYEQEPYQITQLAADELQIIVSGDLVSVRALGQRLLSRAGITVPDVPPSTLSLISVLPEKQIDRLVNIIGQGRVRSIEEIWPEFRQVIAGRIDLLYKSDKIKKEMQRALRRVDHKRKGRNLQAWLPIHEEIEHTLQTTGATVRTELAQQGVADPDIETEVGLRLLGDLDLSVRLTLSRTVRPKYIPPSSSLLPGLTETEILVASTDGDFLDWVVAAYIETELIIGDDYDSPVENKVNVYYGASYTANQLDVDGMPFGKAYYDIWRSSPLKSMALIPFHGPLIGLDIVRDTFGPITILVPHPVVPIAGQLTPTTFERGLTLVDSDGNPAVVCKTWKQKFIDEEYLADQEHIIEGMQLLIRPDIFDAVSEWTIEPARCTTFVRIDEPIDTH